ncbi:hypothetical protein ACWXVW_11125 [Pantoea dispersa]|uniref:hypothetical protein n=1 Tax=Pantoea dispersa TaxID=59814 RepID=UPI002DBC1888|nr:hypothetical protein [Pantoea dispersa]MEB5972980.1 hypothetical protein [Pantoea dispersa]
MFDLEKGIVTFKNSLTLAPEVTKSNLFGEFNIKWEGWPEKKGNKTVSYKTILKGDRKFGDIYLIVDFLQPNDINSQLSSWRFSPEKLLMGEQKNLKVMLPEG